MALTNVLIGVLVAVSRFILYSSRTGYCPSVSLVEAYVGEYRHVVQTGSCHFQLMRNSFVVDGSVLSRYCYWLNCLLFLAGDIALNPGPICFPCTVCCRPVCSNQRGIQCDDCQEWTHASCTHVSVDFYHKLESQTTFSWFCPSCLFTELPLCDQSSSDLDVESSDSSVETFPIISDVLDDRSYGVRIIHHNIQGLLSKSTDVCQWLSTCVDSASIIVTRHEKTVLMYTRNLTAFLDFDF